MLMDLFYDSLDFTTRKRRVHFHAFMQEIHHGIRQWQKNSGKYSQDDVMDNIAKQIAKQYDILCFDEMQINDIADAMVIGRIFQELFDEGVVMVTTSNRHPDELYKNGLQRDRFIPYIELMKENMEIHQINSHIDYRLKQIKSLKTVYFSPLGKESEKFIKKVENELLGEDFKIDEKISVEGRSLIIPKSKGSNASFEFKDLCEAVMGANDYLAIAGSFSTVIISNIPELGKDDYNAAIRFIKLIDALYEANTKLICSAANSPDKLYLKGENSFEFQRTASRLFEMQSDAYLAKEHKG